MKSLQPCRPTSSKNTGPILSAPPRRAPPPIPSSCSGRPASAWARDCGPSRPTTSPSLTTSPCATSNLGNAQVDVALASGKCTWSGLKGRRVPRLVEGQFSAVRQADRSEQPPALVGHASRHFAPLIPQFGERDVDVVTHQVKLMAGCTVGWMNSKLGRGQGED